MQKTCCYNDIDVIALPELLVEDVTVMETYLKFIKNKNLRIYIYTVNKRSSAKQYFDMGVGVYTDFLF